MISSDLPANSTQLHKFMQDNRFFMCLTSSDSLSVLVLTQTNKKASSPAVQKHFQRAVCGCVSIHLQYHKKPSTTIFHPLQVQCSVSVSLETNNSTNNFPVIRRHHKLSKGSWTLDIFFVWFINIVPIYDSHIALYDWYRKFSQTMNAIRLYVNLKKRPPECLCCFTLI